MFTLCANNLSNFGRNYLNSILNIYNYNEVVNFEIHATVFIIKIYFLTYPNNPWTIYVMALSLTPNYYELNSTHIMYAFIIQNTGSRQIIPAKGYSH